MKTSELFPAIFGLIIRSTGLYVALRGLGSIYAEFINFIGNIRFEISLNIFLGVPVFLLGLWLLTCPKQLLSFSYPGQQQKIE